MTTRQKRSRQQTEIFKAVLTQKSEEYNAFKTMFFNDGFHGNQQVTA